jgi:hypothetical protein
MTAAEFQVLVWPTYNQTGFTIILWLEKKNKIIFCIYYVPAIYYCNEWMATGFFFGSVGVMQQSHYLGWEIWRKNCLKIFSTIYLQKIKRYHKILSKIQYLKVLFHWAKMEEQRDIHSIENQAVTTFFVVHYVLQHLRSLDRGISNWQHVYRSNCRIML